MVNNTSTILITGASSGLGLAFIKHYTSIPSPPTVIALDNQPFPHDTIATPNASKLHFHHIDITDTTSVQSLAATYAGTRLSLILHCAGIRGLVPSIISQEKHASRDVSAAETLSAMDKATMLRTFEVNTWGTFHLIRSFLSSLQSPPSSSPGAKDAAAAAAARRPRVVVLSSRMGSVSANSAGGGYAYRASKAALNAVVKSLAVDVPNVQFLLLHPGRVETGLVAWKEEGAIGVEESVGDCLRVMERMVQEEWESARLVDRFGEEIAW